jgi:DNA-3-methyladenine glycosylase
VALSEGRGHAVLVRAVEPVSGIDEGARTSGPGLVTRALGITRAHDGVDLVAGDVTISARARRPARIAVTARVGVAYAGSWADKPWRFFDPSSPCVSRPQKSAVGRKAR